MSTQQMQSTLTDGDTYELVAAAGAGYMPPFVLDNIADRFVPMDVPDVVTGLAAVALASAYGGEYSTPLMAGAGAYTFDAAARRFGIRSTVGNLGGE